MKPPGPLVPIVLGVSLIGLGTAYLYALYSKRRQQQRGTDVTDSLSKLSKLVGLAPSVPPSEAKVIEIVISNKLVPLVVGRKGYTLKHIQETTETEIRFREKDDSHQVCEIRGPSESCVRHAEELIMKEASRQVTMTEEILVPQTACGKILGRCGDSLQEICRKSLAKVWLEGTRTRGESRRVMITGTQAQINVAKSLIEQKVQEDADLRKTMLQTDVRREPRIRSPTSSISTTSLPKDTTGVPVVEKLKSTSSSGQLEVFVSAVVSPGRFYLQLVGPQSSELDILVDAMTEYYNQPQSRELHQIRKPYLGQIVAAEFNADNKWYRAEVAAILPNEFKTGEVVLDLYFVDYGDNQYVNPTEVYELRPDFLALRFQAIECFLAHVEPIGGTREDEWNPLAISRFEELTHVAQWKKVISKIATYKNKSHHHQQGREGSPVPGVELYDTTPDGTDINIGEELINEGMARMAANNSDLTRSQLLRLEGGSHSSSIADLSLTSNGTTMSTSSHQHTNGLSSTGRNGVNGGDTFVDGEIRHTRISANPLKPAQNGATTKAELLIKSEAEHSAMDNHSGNPGALSK